MGKRNKARYKSKPVKRVEIVLSGMIYLMYVDDEKDAQKGDIMLYPINDPLNSTHLAAYDNTGFSGYFKAKICNGKEWQQLVLSDIFEHRENYFTKTERPIDTYHLCVDILRGYKDKVVIRSFRDHYELDHELLASEVNYSE